MVLLLSQASTFEIVVLCVLTAIAGLVFGLISNAILRETGFGVAVNGVLIVLGCVAGACVRLAI